MAITVVQSLATTSNPATLGSPVTGGNTLLVAIAAYTTASGNPTTSLLTLGGSPVTGTVAFFNPGTTNGFLSPLSGSNGAYLAFWMLPGIPGGGTSVGFTVSGANGVIGQVIFEVAGLGPAPFLDQSHTGGAASGTSATSGATAAITAQPEFILGATMAFSGTANTASGFTVLQPAGGVDLAAGYQIATSSGGTYTWAQTTSGAPWGAGVVTVAAQPVPAPRYPLKGARPKLIIPLLTGRVIRGPGTPVNNPGVVPVHGAMPGPVRAALPPIPRGAAASRSVLVRPGITFNGSASLTAAGTMNTPAVIQMAPVPALTAAGTATANSGTGAQGSASLTAAGTVTADGAITGSAVITAASAVTAPVAQLAPAALTAAGIARAGVVPPFQVARSVTAAVTDPRDGTATVS